ncbi:hypothetical protein G6F24_017132 [Rhizopus arrhizus]|nr:hypothetical protein G6F24_017132 [Rhizopus arrhizus]
MAAGIAVGMGGQGPMALLACQHIAGQAGQQYEAPAIVGNEGEVVQAGVQGTRVGQAQGGGRRFGVDLGA